MATSWWERHPQWLDQELKALDAARIRYCRDEDAAKHGVLRLHLELDVGQETLNLVATYPDLYPYFRFEVQAPGIALSHHQNPLEKNLCLMRRGTEHWSPDETLASVLTAQMGKVLKSGRSEQIDEVVALEAPQAEPLSTYYPCAPGIVIVGSNWTVDRRYLRGRFVVGTRIPQGAQVSGLVQGAVLEIQDESKNVLAAADNSVRKAFAGIRFEGRWARVDEAILEADALLYLKRLFELVPWLRDAKANQCSGSWFKLWGVCFPEEVRQRQLGEGWLFVVRSDKNYSALHRDLSKLRRQV